jgi:hypothetical protein
MNQFRSSVALLCLSLFTLVAHAQSIPLQDIDRAEFGKIVSDFSANSQHTSVSGASSLGEIFGFELGLVAGVTNTPEINRIAKEQDPNANVSRLPHGELIGMLSVPAGVTVEFGFIPKVGSNEFKFNSYALGAKWTFTDLFFELPVNLALKAQYASSHLEFNSVIQTVDTHFKYDNSVTSFLLLVSKDFGLFEPYAGFGTANGNGKMVVNGAQVFSDTEYAASQSASASKSSMVLMLGTEVKLGIVKLGIEYGRLYSTNSFTGKLSFYF